VALTLITASITPGNSSDFNVTNNCGNSLAANSSCAMSVTFTPTAVGTRTASLTVTDQFRTQSVALSGVGVAPPGVSLSPATVTFTATGVGLTSQPQTLTLTNNGGLPLTISSVVASSGFTIATNSCGTTLAVSSNCALQIVFTPSVAGPVNGTLTFTDNAPSTTQTATLSGTGVDFSLAANGPTTATLSTVSTSPATYALLLSSISSLSGTVKMSCSGAPKNATCTVTPSSPSLGSTVSIVVSVQTGVGHGELTPPHLPWMSHNNAFLLALLLPLGFSLRRRRTALRLVAICTLALVSLSGCGAARTIPCATACSISSSPTPAGTYNLLVTGSASNLARSVGLTLIVQ
jgi:hypothetical protein